MYPNRVISMRSLILLAVAAIVALGVGIGIFVVLSSPPGDVSGGPLSGAIAVPGPTTVNPTPMRTRTTDAALADHHHPVTASGEEPFGGSCCQYRLSGVLLDYTGAPVAGRSILPRVLGSTHRRRRGGMER